MPLVSEQTRGTSQASDARLAALGEAHLAKRKAAHVRDFLPAIDGTARVPRKAVHDGGAREGSITYSNGRVANCSPACVNLPDYGRTGREVNNRARKAHNTASGADNATDTRSREATRDNGYIEASKVPAIKQHRAGRRTRKSQGI
jgi:hypothetical protein